MERKELDRRCRRSSEAEESTARNISPGYCQQRWLLHLLELLDVIVNGWQDLSAD